MMGVLGGFSALYDLELATHTQSTAEQQNREGSEDITSTCTYIRVLDEEFSFHFWG
jgi:hypothetical protein